MFWNYQKQKWIFSWRISNIRGFFFSFWQYHYEQVGFVEFGGGGPRQICTCVNLKCIFIFPSGSDLFVGHRIERGLPERTGTPVVWQKYWWGKQEGLTASSAAQHMWERCGKQAVGLVMGWLKHSSAKQATWGHSWPPKSDQRSGGPGPSAFSNWWLAFAGFTYSSLDEVLKGERATRNKKGRCSHLSANSPAWIPRNS